MDQELLTLCSKCRLIISNYSRLDTRITGGKPSTFGRIQKIIMVDIES